MKNRNLGTRKLKNGQSSTTFAVLVIALSFVMMLGTFAASNVMKSKTTKTINTLFVEAITDKVLLTLVEMKIIINTTDTYNFTRVIAIPEVIGNKPFTVAGRGSLLEVRTLDNTAVFKETNVGRVWEGLNITGAAGSSGGKITLDYIRGRREIRIS